MHLAKHFQWLHRDGRMFSQRRCRLWTGNGYGMSRVLMHWLEIYYNATPRTVSLLSQLFNRWMWSRLFMTSLHPCAYSTSSSTNIVYYVIKNCVHTAMLNKAVYLTSRENVASFKEYQLWSTLGFQTVFYVTVAVICMPCVSFVAMATNWETMYSWHVILVSIFIKYVTLTRFAVHSLHNEDSHFSSPDTK